MACWTSIGRGERESRYELYDESEEMVTVAMVREQLGGEGVGRPPLARPDI